MAKELKHFVVGDVVRYADAFCAEYEKNVRAVVIEWFDDVQRGYIANPEEKYFCGFRKESVTADMIEHASAEDVPRALRAMRENGFTF